MELGYVLGLSAITFTVLGIIVYLGLKLDKAVQKRAPEVKFPLHVTQSGTVLFASIVGFWVICVAVRVLRPGSSFGSFLGDVDGTSAVVIGSLVFAGIAAEILERLGYPIARRDSPTRKDNTNNTDRSSA